MNNKKLKISEEGSIDIPLILVIKDSKIVKVIDSTDESKMKNELKKYK